MELVFPLYVEYRVYILGDGLTVILHLAECQFAWEGI